MEDQNLQELAALLDGHQVTDGDGKLQQEAEDASPEKSAAQKEKPSDDITPTAEKPTEAEAASTQEEAPADESNFGVDESGKRYVPEERLKKETKRFRETERKLKDLESKLAQGNALLQNAKNPTPPLPEPERHVDKADILELKLTKSQFNPSSSDYNRELDELAGKIFKATPGISVMEAAEEAEKYAQAIATRTAGVRTEARQIKALQADQGIAGHSAQRTATSVDPNNMSLEEMEAYLKGSGDW